MNNQSTGSGHGFTIWGTLGPVMTLVCVVVALTCIVLFVSGLVHRFRGHPIAAQRWWLRQLAVWVFLAGLASYALRWVALLAPVYGGGMSKPEFWQDCSCEAWTRLAAGALTSLAAWTLVLGLGRQDDESCSNKSPEATQETRAPQG